MVSVDAAVMAATSNLIQSAPSSNREPTVLVLSTTVVKCCKAPRQGAEPVPYFAPCVLQGSLALDLSLCRTSPRHC